MKKFIFAAIFIGFLWSYDHVVLNQYRSSAIDWAKNKAAGVVDKSPKGHALILKEMNTHFDQYSTAEIDYITRTTASPEKVKKFYRAYCNNSDFNPILYGEHRSQFCRVINKHRKKLNAKK
ncbi:hypothetical protein [Flocculibacter collagenilyticus]|uniref:hypothetical protein n=1 Tax=Flocculibacter collagenilyticus TaxID=2744479 RepID=UPI0018F3D3FA|nr:hypothetical protein [Flocculibacter collagenilyticus]